MSTRLKVLAVAVSLGAAIGACSSNAVEGQQAKGSAKALTELAGRSIALDFEPLTDASHAVLEGDLIVKGTLTEITEGIRLNFNDSAVNAAPPSTYATFVITVDKVLDGEDRNVIDGKVYVAVMVGADAKPVSLKALNPQPKIVAVLDDITAWSPAPSVTVVRPSTVSATAPLYAPIQDGFWLQGDADPEMVGIDVAPRDLRPGWNKVSTVDQFAAEISKVTGRN